ncbi:hypothetical protein AAMO2058_000905300 [Amorphochlora amoebiformis]
MAPRLPPLPPASPNGFRRLAVRRGVLITIFMLSIIDMSMRVEGVDVGPEADDSSTDAKMKMLGEKWSPVLNGDEQNELHLCFGGDIDYYENRPTIQEDGYGSITPARYLLPSYWSLSTYLRRASNILVVGYGSGAMIGYMWAELSNSSNHDAHIHAVDIRGSKKKIAHRNLEKNGTYMTGKYSERSCHPLPVPADRYTLHSFDAFKDIMEGKNEVGKFGKSFLAEKGPYDVIFVSCCVLGRSNMLDLILKLLANPQQHHRPSAIVFPFEMDPPFMGFVFFATDGACHLIGYCSTSYCEGNAWNTHLDQHMSIRYWTQFQRICDFLVPRYEEDVKGRKLQEIRDEFSVCTDCNRTKEQHTDMDFWADMPFLVPSHGSERLYFKQFMKYEKAEWEYERQQKWIQDHEKELIQEERLKRKHYTKPEGFDDPNIPYEWQWKTIAGNPNLRLPRGNDRGEGLGMEWWEPPQGYQSPSDSLSPIEEGTTLAPLYIVTEPGEQVFEPKPLTPEEFKEIRDNPNHKWYEENRFEPVEDHLKRYEQYKNRTSTRGHYEL